MAAKQVFEVLDESSNGAVIKVIGVGGGGGNAVYHMVKNEIEGVQFICANTDSQALKGLDVEVKVQLGIELTKGLGAGTRPEVGRQAAEESREHIKELLSGADMVFLTAGMGGGTGTGAISVIAEIAKELGILTVAVVTKPFKFEGSRKQKAAETGITELEKYVHSLIIIPNEKLLPVLGDNIDLIEAFEAVNDVLLEGVKGITELITKPGYMNVDFADVETVMSNLGAAIMGSGVASGENRAKEAAEKAISCPLLEDVNLQEANGILVNVTAEKITLTEFAEVGEIMHNFASNNADVKIGMAVVGSDMGDELKVTVVATGLGGLVEPAVQVAQRVSTDDVNYDILDKPAVLRVEAAKKAQVRPRSFGAQSKGAGKDNLDYLNINSFLRKKAD